jgi:putative glutamine amidotransferase
VTVRRIAVLQVRADRPHAPGYQRLLDELGASTLGAIGSLEWDAVVVAGADAPAEASLAAARDADAIVLLGGEDVHPARYGGPADYPGSGRHEPGADDAHLAVVRLAASARIPLLGICRGHQLVNVAFGGTLVPHLGTVANHRREGAADPFVASRAAVLADADLFADVDPAEPTWCTHHQAIDRLGDGLRVVARAPDGVIEAVVHESAPITGVQWHPEHPRTAPTQLTALLRRLERQSDTLPS